MTTGVMVVDDDTDIRETLTELLVEEGYAVSAFGNGHLALEALRAGQRPGVILLDLMMPVMDGWEFRRAQLADPALDEIPVVLITAVGTQRIRSEEFSQVLRKPLRLDRVLDAVARFAAAASAPTP
jgi:CheY-like chemotaxis protein